MISKGLLELGSSLSGSGSGVLVRFWHNAIVISFKCWSCILSIRIITFRIGPITCAFPFLSINVSRSSAKPNGVVCILRTDCVRSKGSSGSISTYLSSSTLVINNREATKSFQQSYFSFQQLYKGSRNEKAVRRLVSSKTIEAEL